tara:strand:- start:1297 stop:1614 length:318 start_codon:yes stop_codon:yes gene_type:complete
MISKKIILGIFIVSLLSGCSSPTAMLGPVYTLTSTGNVYQTGFSYGSNQLITKYTGKTPIENLKNIEVKDIKKNTLKETLESDDFYQLVNGRIKKTREILNFSNQ